MFFIRQILLMVWLYLQFIAMCIQTVFKGAMKDILFYHTLQYYCHIVKVHATHILMGKVQYIQWHLYFVLNVVFNLTIIVKGWQEYRN